MFGSTVVRILVNGKPIKVFTDSEGKSWIEAREGTSYQIEIKNNSYSRVLAVTSIDGINVITGKKAELKPNDGYVINPYSSLKIDGWRISDDKVKEFLFTFDKSKSYSVKLGAGSSNLGAIGVAVYDEKTYYTTTYTTSGGWWNGTIPYTPLSATISSTSYKTTADLGADYSVQCSTTSNGINIKGLLRSAAVNTVDFQAGTAKGKEVDSACTSTYFNPGTLSQMHTFYYDSYKNLVKRGIIVKNKMPQPFMNTGYCPDV